MIKKLAEAWLMLMTMLFGALLIVGVGSFAIGLFNAGTGGQVTLAIILAIILSGVAAAILDT